MCKFCKKSVKLFSMVVGVLFVVYFWNLDRRCSAGHTSRLTLCSTESLLTLSSDS